MSTLKTAILASLFSGYAQPAPTTSPAPLAPITRAADADTLDALHAEAEAVLSEAGIQGVVTGRIKSPESVQAKMQRKGLRADEVLDRLALRVRVETVEDCYAVQSGLSARYAAVPGAADDYIANPKANGYQSLHSAVYTPHGVVEFQIRTHDMHAHAEIGGAAHWRYKQMTAA